MARLFVEIAYQLFEKFPNDDFAKIFSSKSLIKFLVDCS